jgi:ATPase family associated with various cellular activities (AAA)
VSTGAAGRDAVDADLAELWDRLGGIERRVRELVAARRAADPNPDDPYRGGYLTEDGALRILAERGPGGIPVACGPAGGRLGRLADRFGLAPVDVELLLVAVTPDLDARFERLYGYLNDDLTRRRATVRLALELCGLAPAGPGRFRLAAAAPLLAGGLIEVADPQSPALTRQLRVPDRVVAHLLGHDALDPALTGLAELLPPAPGSPEPGQLRRRLVTALAGELGPVHLRESAGGASAAAAAALAATGRPALLPDLVALADLPEPGPALAALAREARLRGAGIVAGPLQTLDLGRPEPVRLLRRLVAATAGVPLLTYGSVDWSPQWTRELPVPVPVPAPAATHPGALAAYRLGPEQVDRATALAGRLAALDGRPIEAGDLRAAARTQHTAGLDRLARRITPAVGWADLVLPDQTRDQLRELVTRARYRDQVIGAWGMRPGGGRGRGVVALFAGESGTGKTMSAEVVAAELGMDLYVVDLSGVVDKYVGETEKNLERVFTAAAGAPGILLFDEADAIFGKRSETRDAHDRYANIESAYLLQRIESFDGVAVLTTNLRSNVDQAFTRRFDVIADFPKPDADQRRALWDRCLGPLLPRAGDLDLRFCAQSFELAGGSIRSCAVTAAYLAAEAGRPVAMADLVAAIRQEYRKLGRLLLDAEFGTWLSPAPA